MPPVPIDPVEIASSSRGTSFTKGLGPPFAPGVRAEAHGTAKRCGACSCCRWCAPGIIRTTSASLCPDGKCATGSRTAASVHGFRGGDGSGFRRRVIGFRPPGPTSPVGTSPKPTGPTILRGRCPSERSRRGRTSRLSNRAFVFVVFVVWLLLVLVVVVLWSRKEV